MLLFWLPASLHAGLKGCSGMPGDFRTPIANSTRSVITHGPGTSNMPQVMEKDAWGKLRPGVLYVLDDAGGHVILGHPLRKMLLSDAFGEAEKVAFWGEMVDDQFYLVPNWDKCQIAAQMGDKLSLLAPEKGLLFLQFAGSKCDICTRQDDAISEVIERNPDMNASWVRIELNDQ
ncbi:MAG: hypothetical protein R3F15_15100 [Lysobacterales bacterium]